MRIDARLKSSWGFTLIELLTVIAIIGILAAILIPVVGRVRASARAANCLTNLRQMGIGFHLYAMDNAERIPRAAPPGGRQMWWMEIDRYLELADPDLPSYTPSEIFQCPSDQENLDSSVTDPQFRRSYGINWIWTSTAPYLAHYPRIDSPASPSGTLLVAETKTAALGTSFIIPGTAHLHNLPNFHEAGNIHVLYFGGNVGSVAHTDVQDVSSEFVDNLFGRRPGTNEPQL